MPVWEITCSGLLLNNSWQNVFHVITDPGGPTPSGIADIIDTHWVDNFRTWQHNFISWLDIGVRDVSTIPSPVAFHKTINKVGGGGAATSNDNPVSCMVVKKQTAVAGRTGRGRIMVGGIRISPSTNLGQVTPATLTAFTTTLTTIMNAIGPSGTQPIELGLCSRSDPEATFKSVISLQLRVILATERTRNYVVGA